MFSTGVERKAEKKKRRKIELFLITTHSYSSDHNLTGEAVVLVYSAMHPEDRALILLWSKERCFELGLSGIS